MLVWVKSCLMVQVKHGVRANWSQQSEKVSACMQELMEVIQHTHMLEELAVFG